MIELGGKYYYYNPITIGTTTIARPLDVVCIDKDVNGELLVVFQEIGCKIRLSEVPDTAEFHPFMGE